MQFLREERRKLMPDLQSFVRTLIKLINEGSSMRKYKGEFRVCVEDCLPC